VIYRPTAQDLKDWEADARRRMRAAPDPAEVRQRLREDVARDARRLDLVALRIMRRNPLPPRHLVETVGRQNSDNPLDTKK
jgi:hypothetical protein